MMGSIHGYKALSSLHFSVIMVLYMCGVALEWKLHGQPDDTIAYHTTRQTNTLHYIPSHSEGSRCRPQTELNCLPPRPPLCLVLLIVHPSFCHPPFPHSSPQRTGCYSQSPPQPHLHCLRFLQLHLSPAHPPVFPSSAAPSSL